MSKHLFPALLIWVLMPAPAPAQFLCGDCSQDGRRNVVDALVAAQHAAGLHPPASPGVLHDCDVDGSGAIAVLDALSLARMAAGSPFSLVCDAPGWSARERAFPGVVVAGAAYDSLRDRVLLAGGIPAATRDSSDITLEWDGVAWWRPQPGHGPGVRERPALAFDAARGETVLFGGERGFPGPDLRDTWTWDGTTWQPQAPAVAPIARRGAAMAYDGARQVTLLFGGFDYDVGYSGLTDTWQWDGATWSQAVPLTTPSPVASPFLAFDEARSVVVLVGLSSAGTIDTWEWDGSDWSQLLPATVPTRWPSGLAYDPMRGTVMLTTGAYVSDLTEAWEWDGVDWSFLSAATTPQAYPGPLVRAPGGGLLLVGGTASGATSLWHWDGGQWSSAHQPSGPRPEQPIAFDSNRGVSVCLARSWDSATSATWEWDGSAWTENALAAGPLLEDAAAMAFDPVRGQIVLVREGSSPGSVTAETWTYDGVAWTQRFPAVAPYGVRHAAMTFDSARGVVLLFVGLADVLAETWEWDGATWTQRISAVIPPRAEEPCALAYDSLRGRAVLYGGDTDPHQPVWEWDGTDWLSLQPAFSPYAVWWPAMAFDDVRGVTLVRGLGGFEPGSVASTHETWSWDGSAWRNLAVESYAPTSYTSEWMTFDSARGRAVLLNSGADLDYRGTWER